MSTEKMYRLSRVHIGVQDTYAPRFGLQRLQLWSPPFASTFEGWANERPNGRGFVVHMEYGPTFMVDCESPRTEENYSRVDDAIRAAIDARTVVDGEE